MEYHDLQKTTVVKLRDMVTGYGDVKGATGLNKAQLIDLIADREGISKPHKVVVGINKPLIKAELKTLRQQRDAAIEIHDRSELKRVRRKMHRVRRQLHKAATLK